MFCERGAEVHCGKRSDRTLANPPSRWSCIRFPHSGSLVEARRRTESRHLLRHRWISNRVAQTRSRRCELQDALVPLRESAEIARVVSLAYSCAARNDGVSLSTCDPGRKRGYRKYYWLREQLLAKTHCLHSNQ